MPPIRSQNRSKLIEKEGRILLAIQAIKKQEKLSITEAVQQRSSTGSADEKTASNFTQPPLN
ncbi:hypothetical protein N7478_011597 [Penicillium angulare]|uniref:uncharacterized protein n=1 Tax=Penicillium angulare TaxID=116970 RepID=UPI002540A41C|nr:uncharacterized protein N7478_011597 [Penicillium angulare]KAJ5261002.1 hypothetical protein N7478_011597 [Penicillium angulare]